MRSLKATTSEKLSRLGWKAGLLAVAIGCGTLMVVNLLPVMGVSFDFNEGPIIGIILVLLAVTLLGLSCSFTLHRHAGPLVLAAAAAALLLWVFYASHSQTQEIIGFGGLAVASVWDFRARKRNDVVKS